MSAPMLRTLTRPLIDENPVTLQILGICSALAITRRLDTALVMGAAVIFVVTLSNRSWIIASVTWRTGTPSNAAVASRCFGPVSADGIMEPSGRRPAGVHCRNASRCRCMVGDGRTRVPVSRGGAGEKCCAHHVSFRLCRPDSSTTWREGNGPIALANPSAPGPVAHSP